MVWVVVCVCRWLKYMFFRFGVMVMKFLFGELLVSMWICVWLVISWVDRMVMWVW